jgi:membrane associated rhomboid family serine protease
VRASWQDSPQPRGMYFGMPSLTPVVKALLIANIAVFVLQYVVLEGTFQRAFELFEKTFSLNPQQWRDFFPLVPLWQLVSYGFLHADVGHILYNLLFLYFMGTMLEQELGSRRMCVFYFVSLVLAGAFQLVLGCALGHFEPIVGASGAVLACAFALATIHPNMRVVFIVVPITLRALALIYGSIELFGAIMQLKGHASSAASFAHLSGALFGYLAVRLGWIWRDPVAEVGDWRERRAEAQAATDEERLDNLLAKINREGIHALSSGEREFLKRVSRK